MLRFRIEEYESQLNLSQRWWLVLWLCMSQGIAFLFTLLVFIVPYEKLIEFHEYAYLIYVIPVLPVLRLVSKLYRFYKRRTFSFVKHEDALYQKKKLVTQLSAISRLELFYKERGENEVILLQLVTVEGEIIVLAQGNGFILKDLGIRIAKFLSIEFINTNSLYDRVIWGGVSASEPDIRFMEEGM